MAIEYGSIEVIRNGESFGVPVTPLFPLSVSQSELPDAIKARTGVQVGAISQPSEEELARLGLVQPLGRRSGDDGHGATGARLISLRRVAHGGGGAAWTVDMKRFGGRLGVGGQGRRAQKGG